MGWYAFIDFTKNDWREIPSIFKGNQITFRTFVLKGLGGKPSLSAGLCHLASGAREAGFTASREEYATIKDWKALTILAISVCKFQYQMVWLGGLCSWDGYFVLMPVVGFQAPNGPKHKPWTFRLLPSFPNFYGIFWSNLSPKKFCAPSIPSYPSKLGGGFVVSHIFHVHPYSGKIPHFGLYFSMGLKPPTRRNKVTRISWRARKKLLFFSPRGDLSGNPVMDILRPW